MSVEKLEKLYFALVAPRESFYWFWEVMSAAEFICYGTYKSINMHILQFYYTQFVSAVMCNNPDKDTTTDNFIQCVCDLIDINNNGYVSVDRLEYDLRKEIEYSN